MKQKIQNILETIQIAEKLKREVRHSWLSDGRQESTAEHSWRVAFMAVIIAPELSLKFDLQKVLKIAAIHDLMGAEAYDIPAYEKGRAAKKAKVAGPTADKIRELLGGPAGEEIYGLWREFEEQSSIEAKIVKALSKIEVRLQHNEAGLETWNETELPRSQYVADESVKIDDFLKELNELIKQESREKIVAAGHDLKAIQTEARELTKEA